MKVLDNYQTIKKYALEANSAQVHTISLLKTRFENHFVKIVELLMHSKGHFIIAGMGKSGLVGKKIAATLASTGTPSFFLHPAEALHGDLGMISTDDAVMLISNSGETDEILRMLPALKHFGNTVIAMTGNTNSTLARFADYNLDISVDREICPLNLAPTTSTLATMAMGDILAVTLMNLRSFQSHDFARFHPAGNLGRRLLTKVQDVMHQVIPRITVDTDLRDAMMKMTESRLGVAIVMDKQKLLGVFTDGDLRRALSQENAVMDEQVEKYMTCSPATIDSESMLFDAEQLMNKRKIKCLVVTHNDKVVGLLDIFDLK